MDRDAWLAQVTEDVIEPDLPICDPTTTFGTTPAAATCSMNCSPTSGSGHNVALHGIHGVRLDVPRRRPRGAEARRRNRVRERHRGDECERRLRRRAGVRSLRRLRGPEPRGGGRRCARCARRKCPVPRHPARGGLGCKRRGAQFPHRACPGHDGGFDLSHRLRGTWQARHDLRTAGCTTRRSRNSPTSRARSRISRSSSTTSAARLASALTKASEARDLRPVERQDVSGTRNQCDQRRRQARRPRHGHQRLRLPQARTPGYVGRTRGRHSRLPPAHDRLLWRRAAACSKATSRWTR